MWSHQNFGCPRLWPAVPSSLIVFLVARLCEYEMTEMRDDVIVMSNSFWPQRCRSCLDVLLDEFLLFGPLPSSTFRLVLLHMELRAPLLFPFGHFILPVLVMMELRVSWVMSRNSCLVFLE